MNFENLISGFVNSWKFVVVVLILAFLVIFKKTIETLLGKVSLEKILNKVVGMWNKNKTQAKFTPKEDLLKIKKFFTDIKVKSFDDFYNQLTVYVQSSERTKSKVQELEKSNQELFNLWKVYMFSYLDLFLVYSSKSALLWFYNHPYITKDYFTNNFILPNFVVDQNNQKEIIFNILLQNYLILKDVRDLYSVTNIGRDFLIFINFIK